MWYYMKDGWFDSTKEGPIDDDEFSVMAFDGKLKRSTLVVHQIHTKGDWLKLDDVPRLVSQFEGGETCRAEIAATRFAKEQQAKTVLRELQAAETAKRREEQRAARADPIVAEVVEQSTSQPAVHQVSQFRCPYCSSISPPLHRSETTTAGWIFFVVLFLFLCWPICWIGIFFKESHTYCSQCGIRFN